MASRESHSSDAGLGTLLPVFGICVSSIVMMGEVFFYGNLDFKTLILTSAIPLGLAWALHMIIIALMIKVIPEESTEPMI